MNWTANWIWASERGRARTGRHAEYLLLRRSFSLRQRPRVASAFCTAVRQYQLYVNGAFLGRGPVPPEAPWRPYDAYDLAPHLARGRNAVAAICFCDGATGPPGFLFQAMLDEGAGSSLELISDGSWRTWDASPWRAPASGAAPPELQEVCRPEREPHGWTLAGFDDGSWQAAASLGPATAPAWGRLVPRLLPPLREEVMAPVGVPVRAPGRVLFDFGRVLVGYPRVQISRAAEGTLTLAYGDWLDAEGRVAPRPGQPLQIDRLCLGGIAGGRGRLSRVTAASTWQPFGRRAFRYCEATLQAPGGPSGAGTAPDVAQRSSTTIVDRPITGLSVHLRSTAYPVESRGSFRCSDPRLNEAWELGRDTLAVAMQEQYEKCPVRAPFQTIADARLQALMSLYGFGDYRLAGRALWQMAPRSGERRSPDSDALWLLMLGEYYRASGDARLVRQLFPQARERLAELRAATNEHGLLAEEELPTANGAPEARGASLLDSLPIERQGEVASLNGLYFAALRTATRLASALGQSGAEYEHGARSVQQALNWSLWSAGERAFADCRSREGLGRCGAHTNWLLLASEVVEVPRRGLVLRSLLSDRAAVLRLDPAFQFYVLQSLFGAGAAEDALDLIRSVWGEMRRRGATACWEHLDWDGQDGDPPRGSLCHASSGSPTYFLSAMILGVQPRAGEAERRGAGETGSRRDGEKERPASLSPFPRLSVSPSPVLTTPGGWDTLVIRPCPADLEWAEGVVPTLRGDVRAAWRRIEDGFELHAELPADVQADLHLDWREGESAEWDGRLFWPASRAERGVELDHPVERTASGLCVRVAGPKQITLRTRNGEGARGRGGEGMKVE